ncbi:hypothetical protein [Natronobiforma cellulositropha]|uniref:hypothetical protein n=1 Tax=Natronobiforma cellulositropha TaxID=1679076 RepID=UPI0021D60184|nr:hypothetical protein [Natronobiforma cellulositropha]
MTLEPTLTATVCERTPEAEYEGVVYDQTVTVALEEATTSATRLALFDPSMAVTDDHVGSTVDLAVSVLSSAVERLDTPTRDVRETDEGASAWSYEFLGRVCATDADGGVVLDIGCGTISVEPSADLARCLEAGGADGPHLRVLASRTDLAALE